MNTTDYHTLLPGIRAHVAALYAAYPDTRRVFHAEGLSEFLTEATQQLATAAGATDADAATAAVAGLLYPLGYRMDAAHPQAAVQQAVRQILPNQGTAALEQCLAEIYGQPPTGLPAQLLSDALALTYANGDKHRWADLRQLEQELINGTADDIQQAQLRLQTLLGIRYYTPAGRTAAQPHVTAQLLAQKKQLDKRLRQANRPTDDYDGDEPTFHLEDGTPVRGAQTYFRVVYRNHINLSAIADNKANIMISVNSILISVLITFLSYRNIAETQPMILLPVVIFLVTGLASLVSAVLSARPKVTKLNNDVVTGGQPVRGLAFFGNFAHLPLDRFTSEMDDMFRDGERLYETLTQDLYYLGQVLDKKYRYLTVSYNIFMVGLVVTVVLFLFTLFVG